MKSQQKITFNKHSYLNTHHMMVLVLMLFLCFGAIAQVDDRLFELSITSEAFQDGIAPGETGEININITNLGPNAITMEDNLFVILGFNTTQDIDLFFNIANSPTNDPNCRILLSGDPRPPVDDYLFFYGYRISADIEINETYTCTVTPTFEQSGYLETVWRIIQINNGNIEFIDIPFYFRGQVLPVPLSINFLLILCLLISTAIYIRGKKRLH